MIKITSKNYTKGRNGKRPRLIVIHTMESGEQPNKAKQVANWFRGSTAPEASAHYCVDNLNVIATVDEKDTAWAVGQSDINRESISIELAGSASQSKIQWADTYSKSELITAAKLVADIANRYSIPVVKLQPSQVKTGKGIIGHVDVTKAYGIKGGHTDPGTNFPWTDFIKMVESELAIKKGQK